MLDCMGCCSVSYVLTRMIHANESVSNDMMIAYVSMLEIRHRLFMFLCFLSKVSLQPGEIVLSVREVDLVSEVSACHSFHEARFVELGWFYGFLHLDNLLDRLLS